MIVAIRHSQSTSSAAIVLAMHMCGCSASDDPVVSGRSTDLGAQPKTE